MTTGVSRFAVLLLAGLWIGTSSVFAAQPPGDVTQWLQRMSDAIKSRNYDGIFVYQSGEQLEVMRVIHRVAEDGEHERLYSLNGAAREVIRDNENVTCILPDAQSVWVGKRQPQSAFRLDLPMDLGEITPFYQFVLGQQERVADSVTQAISILPNDGHRYGYRLWLDIDSALPLRSDLINENGESIEQILFTSIDLSGYIDPVNLKPATSGEAFSWEVEDGERQKDMSLVFDWFVEEPPAGFVINARHRNTRTPDDRVVEHVVYSDGLASFSVFVEPDEGDGREEGEMRMGSVNAYGMSVNDHLVTVVGEVPAATVMQVAGSVRFAR